MKSNSIPFSSQKKSKRAIAYYRHSAEDKQEQSIPIQKEHIKIFVQENALELIHEESDAGVSGLTANRPGFQRLLQDWILNPNALDFTYVLVYDVSRWGRFQDQNEAAHYEFLCKERGKQVIYVSRGFPKGEQPLVAQFQTTMDRMMAAEYSKQLSDKVFYGQVKVSKEGYSAGGMAPYGMSRILLDEKKNPIQILKHGEHKVIANQRVTFTPSHDEQPDVIKTIFDLYTNTKKWYTTSDIAENLNGQKIKTAKGKNWTSDKVINIISNETYIGTRLFNKTQSRLGKNTHRNPRSEWVVCQNAFSAIIDDKIFYLAQDKLYWFTQMKWKQGHMAIDKTRKLINEYMNTLLEEQNYSEDLRSEIIRNLPIAYSVVYQHETIPHWCFMIHHGMRLHDYIVAVGINFSEPELIDKFFALPTNAFGAGNFLIISEKDTLYPHYVIDRYRAKDSMLQLCQQIAKRV